ARCEPPRDVKRGRGAASALAGELLPLHVGPDLLRHLGRPDRRASEDGLDGVLTSLEVDRVPPERLLPLRHDLPSSLLGRARHPGFPGGITTTGTRGGK